MDEHLETLINENKKLRGKHNELEVNLTEEKEMVKYLHGVIKNYQKLMKNTETTGHLKAKSIKNRDRFTTVRRQTIEADAEDVVVTETDFCQMSDDYTKVAGTKGKVLRSITPGNSYQESAAVSRPNCGTTYSIINTKCNGQGRSDEKVSSVTVKPDKISKKDHAWVSHLQETIHNGKGRRNDPESDSYCGIHEQFISPSESTASEADMISPTRSKYSDTGSTLQEMAQMLDSMMAKAIMHENALKQKDKHLKRMERRYEYLASIALGEESEWL